jgi:hypothetical protein
VLIKIFKSVYLTVIICVGVIFAFCCLRERRAFRLSEDSELRRNSGTEDREITAIWRIVHSFIRNVIICVDCTSLYLGD